MRIVLALLAAASLHAVPAAKDVPRPEYPQPQFQRDDWMNLDGRWQFAFDDSDAGEPKTYPKTITVPFAFESTLSGIGDTSFHPVVWYKREVKVPRDWKGRH